MVTQAVAAAGTAADTPAAGSIEALLQRAVRDKHLSIVTTAFLVNNTFTKLQGCMGLVAAFPFGPLAGEQYTQQHNGQTHHCHVLGLNVHVLVLLLQTTAGWWPPSPKTQRNRVHTVTIALWKGWVEECRATLLLCTHCTVMYVTGVS